MKVMDGGMRISDWKLPYHINKRVTLGYLPILYGPVCVKSIAVSLTETM